MAWEVFQRDDYFERSENIFISVSNSHFAFNANFSKIAELDPSIRVTVHLDNCERKIGFEFHKEEKRNSFSLSAASSAQKGKKRNGVQ